MSLLNVNIPKGYAKFPDQYGAAPSLVAQAFSNTFIRFNPNQQIQIWQDTEIQDVKYWVASASATDEWYIGLYRYDYPDDKFIKATQWTATAGQLSATGGISLSLSSPITIQNGTYYIGVKSKDNSAGGYADSLTGSQRQMTQYWSGSGLPNSTSGQVTGFQAPVDSSVTDLPSEILNSSTTQGVFTNGQYMPFLIY